MAWVRLDDRRAMHRKLRAAGFAARGVDEAFMCLSAQEGTDGWVSDEMLIDLGRMHGASPAAMRKLAEKLVQVGRWERDESGRGGFLIHDYLDFNPSAADIDQRRRVRAEAGRIGGQRSGQTRRSRSNSEADARSEAEANGKQTGSRNEPRPVPSRPVPSPPVGGEQKTTSDSRPADGEGGHLLDPQRQAAVASARVGRRTDDL